MSTEVAGEMGKLIQELTKKQDEGKITDSAFARKLSISRQMWHYIRQGERQPGLKFLKAIIREYPEFQLLVFQIMAQSNTQQDNK